MLPNHLPVALLDEAALYQAHAESHRVFEMAGEYRILAVAGKPDAALAGEAADGVRMLLCHDEAALHEGGCVLDTGALSLSLYKARMMDITYVLMGERFVQPWQGVDRLCTCKPFSLWGQCPA